MIAFTSATQPPRLFKELGNVIQTETDRALIVRFKKRFSNAFLRLCPSSRGSRPGLMYSRWKYEISAYVYGASYGRGPRANSA